MERVRTFSWTDALAHRRLSGARRIPASVGKSLHPTRTCDRQDMFFPRLRLRMGMCALAYALLFGHAGDANAQVRNRETATKYSAIMGRALIDTMTRHLAMTPLRPGSAGDTLRAQHIAEILRAAIEDYAEVAFAVEHGYRMAPPFPEQRIYHFGDGLSAKLEMSRFDPARPSALLYLRDEADRLQLVGAMYTAPDTSSLAELDRRVPLSIARWHRHVNVCLPRQGEGARWAEERNGHPAFGTDSFVATRQECEEINGRFYAVLDPWMVHAYVIASRDLRGIWGEHDENTLKPHLRLLENYDGKH